MKQDIKSYLRSKHWQECFFNISTYFFVGTLPLFLNLNTIALWFFIGSSILTIKFYNGIFNLKRNFNIFILLSSLFLLFVMGLFLSKDVNRVYKDIGRALPLVLIPLVVFMHKKQDFNLKKIFTSLGVGLFIGMLICWSNIAISIFNRKNPLKQAKYFFEWIYTDVNLVKPLDGHPSYFAILIVLFISVLIYSDLYKGIRGNKIKFLLMLFPYLLFLIETNSRIALFSFLVILIINTFKKRSVKSFLLILLFTISVSILSIKFDYLGSKFLKIINSKGEITAERFLRWKEIIKVFGEKQKFLFGVGSGDARQVYRRAYYNGNFDLALDRNYNAHNQYLEFLVCNGVFGFFLFLIVFVVFVKQTHLKNLALPFFVIFVMFSITETFLGRSQGVMIFSFFYSFLIVIYKKYI